MNLLSRMALVILMPVILYPTLLFVWLLMEIRNALDWIAYGATKVSNRLWRITNWTYYRQPLQYANREVARFWREFIS